MDRRHLYLVRAFVDFMRPKLIETWGQNNRAFYVLPSGTGLGPAVWTHGLLPDYHAFRGSYGGYALPLYDRRAGSDAHNLNPDLLAGLSTAYGRHVTPEEVFDAIAGLLSASSYTRRFAWDLEESFAHVPFPAEEAVFLEAARIGAEIVALETFARTPAAAFRAGKLEGMPSAPLLEVPAIGRAFREDGTGHGAVALRADQSLRMTGVPEAVWMFAVSGYRVLPRWLLARNGEALDAPVQREILDVAWRINELLHWFGEADAVLDAAIARSLTRRELGLDKLAGDSATALSSANEHDPAPA